MTDVAIEYCVPCGLFDPAREVQEKLLSNFGRDIDSVALRPGGGGVFQIAVDGETVWDKSLQGGTLDLNRVVEAVDANNQTA